MANRTLTDTATVTWDEATAGQVKGNVPDNAVTNAKLADMVQATIKGRAAGAGTGDPTDLTATQVAAIVDSFFLTPAEGNTAYQPVDSDLTAIAALTTTAYGRALLALVDDAALQAYIGVREVLIAARTYFVRTDGSDSNTGLVDSAGGAFLTIDKARQVIYTLDLNGFQAKIKLSNSGTRTTGAIFTGMPPGATAAVPILIEGDTATPANVIISTTSASCITALDGANVYVDGVELRTTTSGDCLFATKGGQVIHGNVRFGACAGFHVQTTDGGRRYNSGNFTISGGAIGHQHVTTGGFQLLAACTVTLTGTPVFSSYFVGISAANAQYNACTFSGAATGNRFLIHEGGIINTDGQSITTYFPGSVAGVCVNGTFDDLHLSETFTSGGVIDWATGDVNIIHATNQLNFNGASNGYIFDGPLRATSASAPVGYNTGAGGVITQITDKSTAVTIARPTGAVTMHNQSLGAGVSVSFGVINSTYNAAGGDVITAHHVSGGTVGAYTVAVLANGASTFVLRVTNITGGPLGEAIVINFQVHKGALS